MQEYFGICGAMLMTPSLTGRANQNLQCSHLISWSAILHQWCGNEILSAVRHLDEKRFQEKRHGGASGNRDESLLTRLQYINLCFHFEVEQQVNGVFCNFFGFNGTAGVWRITALEESGRRFARDDNRRGHGHCSRDWKSMFLNDCQQALSSMPSPASKVRRLLEIETA
ncbi:hypothetical protein BHM03_00026151 [Ensete ventricosum]|nr:hypothetical protein BHM03_00026151 [Ensete ventricosum]